MTTTFEVTLSSDPASWPADLEALQRGLVLAMYPLFLDDEEGPTEVLMAARRAVAYAVACGFSVIGDVAHTDGLRLALDEIEGSDVMYRVAAGLPHQQ